MTKKMKNIEIVQALKCLQSFVERQRATETSLLSVKGQFAIKSNNNALIEKYKPYEETLEELRKEENVDPEKVQELFDIEVDVELRTISEDDFKDGCTIDDILLLEFMTE